MTNATYTDYPFTSNGVNFISRIYSVSDMAKTIASMPRVIFEDMNRDAVENLIGDVSLLTIEEVEDELNRVNAGGTHSFILLGENN
jgi:hypothetical protein